MPLILSYVTDNYWKLTLHFYFANYRTRNLSQSMAITLRSSRQLTRKLTKLRFILSKRLTPPWHSSRSSIRTKRIWNRSRMWCWGRRPISLSKSQMCALKWLSRRLAMKTWKRGWTRWFPTPSSGWRSTPRLTRRTTPRSVRCKASSTGVLKQSSSSWPDV